MRNKFEFEELVYEKASVLSNHEHHVIKMGRITATAAAAVLVVTTIGIFGFGNVKGSLNSDSSIANEQNYYIQKSAGNDAAAAAADDAMPDESFEDNADAFSEEADGQSSKEADAGVTAEIIYYGSDNFVSVIDDNSQAEEFLEELASMEILTEKSPGNEDYISCFTVREKDGENYTDQVKLYLIYNDVVLVKEYGLYDDWDIKKAENYTADNICSIELSDDFISMIRTYFTDDFMEE